MVDGATWACCWLGFVQMALTRRSTVKRTLGRDTRGDGGGGGLSFCTHHHGQYISVNVGQFASFYFVIKEDSTANTRDVAVRCNVNSAIPPGRAF